jgi:hypothetical protein
MNLRRDAFHARTWPVAAGYDTRPHTLRRALDAAPEPDPARIGEATTDRDFEPPGLSA